MSVCNEDCFNCIYDDCILGTGSPGRHKISEEEKIRRQQKRQEYVKQYRHARYLKLKAAGICTRCEKNPVKKGVICDECKAYIKERRNGNGKD